jgi:hypothetical protein
MNDIRKISGVRSSADTKPTAEGTASSSYWPPRFIVLTLVDGTRIMVDANTILNIIEDYKNTRVYYQSGVVHEVQDCLDDIYRMIKEAL